ncbi:transposase [Scytonema sp. NUACC26]|uniref:helix-turn-helix domain-containing protein n=1 Tax=Scytonema sp. NUACC26 TaxID=3140176 RepID=UPI0034DC4B21
MISKKYEQTSRPVNQLLQPDIAHEKQSLYLTPFQRKLLVKNLETDLRPEYRRRIEIMLLADMGQSQTQICEVLGCSQETARYWIGMAKAGQAHHWSDRPMGRPKTVNKQYLESLKELVSHSPRDYGYPFQRWTAQWLSKHLEKEFGLKVSDCHITRLLKSMGLSTRHKGDGAQQVAALDNSKNSSIMIRDLRSELLTDIFWFFNPIDFTH